MPNIDLFTTRFNWQLPVYVSPVPDTHTLDVDTLAIRGRDWMPMPIRLPYYPKSSKNSSATSCSSLQDGQTDCGPQIYWDWQIPICYHYQIGTNFFIHWPNNTIWIRDCSSSRHGSSPSNYGRRGFPLHLPKASCRPIAHILWWFTTSFVMPPLVVLEEEE